MAPDSPGMLVIRTIPNDEVARRVTDFICSHAAGATPDKVTAGLASLPLVLAGSLPGATGVRLARALQELGADAQFISEAEKAPPTPVVPPAPDTPSPPSPAPSLPPRSRPSAPARAPQTARHKEEIGLSSRQQCAHTRTLAIHGLLACMVSMVSPVFYLVSLPFALYAVQRACVCLDVPGYLRTLYLISVFVPFGNILFLLVLVLQTTLALRREKRAVPLSGPAANGIAGELGFAALMIMALLGVQGGFLPASFPSLVESIEKQLQREVARSAKRFPLKMNEDLQIDSLTAGPDLVLTFNCTLLKASAAEISPNRFRKSVQGSLRKNVCSDRGLKQHLAKGVTVSYAFSGNDGNPVTMIATTESDCYD